MSRASTDRNLLAGILALQMDFIDRDQLVTAMNAWLISKDELLEQLLLKQGALDPESHGLLSALITRHLKQHGDDAEQSLAALPQLPDIATALPGICDEQVYATLTRANARSNAEQGTLGWQPRRVQPAGSRYRILRLHAKGGLGQVSVAEDEELHREVALKEIQDIQADDFESRARFVQEAEVTGGLEHPGIVPVYGLGHYVNGRPFYAMRLIRGDTLKMALHDYHVALRYEEPGKRAVQFRGLISRFITVCQTMEYAHSRGVVHRDIKPDNIMLGKYGETLVVDWGLAKAVGRPERLRTETPDAETSLRVSTSSGSNPTQQGTAVGTPAYMSPEQAAGRLDQLGPASDIYSLGATLYTILTGKPPVEGKGPTEVMLRVQRGDVAEPRSINADVPRGLQAVCLKALALKPAQRYASAAALAHDLEQWLADEPVTALAESFSQRVGRWGRRHRAVVRAAAGTLLVTAVVLVVAVITINHARVEADVQRGRAQTLASNNKKLADENQAGRIKAELLAKEKERIALDEREQRQKAEMEAQKAGKLAEFLVGLFEVSDPVGQGVTFFIPKTTSEELNAKEILKRGAKQVQIDAELKKFPLAKAAILNSIGDVNRQLSSFVEAEALLEEALRIRRELLPSDHPDLGTSCHNLGQYYHERGDFPKAEPLYREALAIRQKIAGKPGQRATAATLHNLAWMMGNEGKSREAEKLFREVLVLRQKLDGDLHRDVVFTKMGIAFCLIEQSRFFESIPLITAAKFDLEKIEGLQHLSTAVTSFALGVAYRDLPLFGVKASEVELRKALAATDLGLGADSIYSGVVHYELAGTLLELGQKEDAENHFKTCLKISREKVQMQHPRIRLLVSAYADLLVKQGRAEEGISLWQEFVDAQRVRFGKDHNWVAQAELEYAVFLRNRKKYAQAISLLQSLEQIAGAEASLHPHVFNQLGLCHLDGTQDFAQAASKFRQSIAAWQPLIAADPKLAEELLYPQINLAQALIPLQETAEAEKLLQAARAAAKKIGGDVGKDRQTYALTTLSRLYRQERDLKLAGEVIDEHRHLVTNKPLILYRLATELAECVQLALLADADAALTKQLADHTLQALQAAQRAGYKNASGIRRNPVFTGLSEQPEFQAILTAMETNSAK